MRRDKARSDAELEGHRAARADAQGRGPAARTRDACAAELEAVAAEVDSCRPSRVCGGRRRAEQLRRAELAQSETDSQGVLQITQGDGRIESGQAQLRCRQTSRGGAGRRGQGWEPGTAAPRRPTRVGAAGRRRGFERRAAQAERMARTNADEAQDRLRIARDPMGIATPRSCEVYCGRGPRQEAA